MCVSVHYTLKERVLCLTKRGTNQWIKQVDEELLATAASDKDKHKDAKQQQRQPPPVSGRKKEEKEEQAGDKKKKAMGGRGIELAGADDEAAAFAERMRQQVRVCFGRMVMVGWADKRWGVGVSFCRSLCVSMCSCEARVPYPASHTPPSYPNNSPLSGGAQTQAGGLLLEQQRQKRQQ